MTEANQQPGNEQPRGIPTISALLPGDAILETIYRPETHQTAFVLWEDGQWHELSDLSLASGERLVPYSPQNTLLTHEVVLFPAEPEEYGSEEALIQEVQAFIHRHVDVTSVFERIAAYYVLLSWIYDAFNELPYLRLRGDPGSGKTRFLLTVGSLCYKPILASGASSVSPLFRILDAFRGTLIIDEGDFRLSDEKADVVKILNNGNAPGFPVLRTEASRSGELNPRAYAVFGPKLVATRGYFEDRALESRCLTEEMGQGRLRPDIPITLPREYKAEALRIRNKLLLYRFRNLHKLRVMPELVDPGIEPRLNQIFLPLLTLVEDPRTRADLRDLARRYHREMVADRGLDVEAQLLEIIRELQTSPGSPRLSVREITTRFNAKHATDLDRQATPKWIGNILRRKLRLVLQKSHGVFLVPLSEQPKLLRLYERYDVGRAKPEKEQEESSAEGDVGDIGEDVKESPPGGLSEN